MLILTYTSVCSTVSVQYSVYEEGYDRLWRSRAAGPNLNLQPNVDTWFSAVARAATDKHNHLILATFAKANLLDLAEIRWVPSNVPAELSQAEVDQLSSQERTSALNLDNLTSESPVLGLFFKFIGMCSIFVRTWNYKQNLMHTLHCLIRHLPGESGACCRSRFVRPLALDNMVCFIV